MSGKRKVSAAIGGITITDEHRAAVAFAVGHEVSPGGVETAVAPVAGLFITGYPHVAHIVDEATASALIESGAFIPASISEPKE